MARTLKKLYDAERDGTIVRSEDMDLLREQLTARMDAVQTECRTHVEKLCTSLQLDVRNVQDSLATRKEVDDMRQLLVMDSRNYSKECAVEATRQAKMAMDNLDLREEAGRNAMKAETLDALQTQQDGNNALRTELEAVQNDLASRLSAVNIEVMGIVEQIRGDWAARIQESVTQASADANFSREMATSGVQGVSNAVKQLQAETNSKNQQVMSEISKHLERHDVQLVQVARRLEDQLNKEQVRAEGELAAFRNDAERRVDKLEMDSGTLQENMIEALNQSTNKIDWMLPSAVQRLRSSTTRNCFSPKFGAGGEKGLQLELKQLDLQSETLREMAIDDGYESGDCVINVWANKGVKLIFRLHLGGVSTLPIEHEFNGWEPYRSKRIWFLDDQIKQEDGSLQLAIEVLESSRSLAGASSRPSSASAAAAASALGEGMHQDGTLVLNRVVNNRMKEVLHSSLNFMRSHMLRRVEWKIQHASSMRACYTEGKCICSEPFVAAGIDGVQLVFYPSGYTGVRSGYCSLFLTRPQNELTGAAAIIGASNHLNAFLRIGKQRWEALPAAELSQFCGRLNFCRFDNCLDSADDTLTLVLEVQEAPQDVLKVGAQQDAWRNPNRPPGAPSGLSSPKGKKAVRALMSNMKTADMIKNMAKPAASKDAASPNSGSLGKAASSSPGPGKASPRSARKSDADGRPTTAPAGMQQPHGIIVTRPTTTPGGTKRAVFLDAVTAEINTERSGGTGDAGDQVGDQVGNDVTQAVKEPAVVSVA